VLGVYVSMAGSTNEYQAVDSSLIRREHLVDRARTAGVIRADACAVAGGDLREFETLALRPVEYDA
jgi:hypothetical protein